MTELIVTDLAATLRWYRDVLGLHVHLVDEATEFVLLQGFEGGKLALKAGTPVPGGVKLYFEIPDLYAELARLATLDVVPNGPVKVSEEGYRLATLHDPDGHAVVLFEWVRYP